MSNRFPITFTAPLGAPLVGRVYHALNQNTAEATVFASATASASMVQPINVPAGSSTTVYVHPQTVYLSAMVLGVETADGAGGRRPAVINGVGTIVAPAMPTVGRPVVLSPDGRSWGLTVSDNGVVGARLITAPAPPSATTTTDAFTASNGTSLTGYTTSGGTINVQGNKARLAAGSAGGYADVSYAERDAVIAADFEATVDIALVTSIEAYIDFGFRGDGVRSGSTHAQDNGWYVEIIPTFNLIKLGYRLAGASTIVKSAALTLATNDIVHLRVRCEWDVIKVRYWLNSSAEPTTWNWVSRDAYNRAGTSVWFGVLGGNDAAAHTADFDALATTPLLRVDKDAGPYPWRGVGIPGLTHPEDITTLGAQWWMDWGSDGGRAQPTKPGYVPIVWGDWAYFGWAADHPTQAAVGYTHLMGFNEPDSATQSNVTYQRALDLWPWMEVPGVRIGSPATTSAAEGVTWMDNFMAGVESRGLRVDFVCLHWYGDITDPQNLVVYIKDALAKYGRPVWLTEFSGYTYTRAQNITFMTAVLPLLRDIPGLERISWFANRDGAAESGYEFTGLLDASGASNSLGALYTAVGPKVSWVNGTAGFLS